MDTDSALSTAVIISMSIMGIGCLAYIFCKKTNSSTKTGEDPQQIYDY